MRHTHGSIEVICGSMFSGKTDELIRRLVRATIARQKVQVFKPAIDVRYAVEKVASHTGSTFDAIPVEKATDIRSRLDTDTTVVGIDEAQFFDPKGWMWQRNLPHAECGCWLPVWTRIFAASRLARCPF